MEGEIKIAITTDDFISDIILFIRNSLRDGITDPISATRKANDEFVMTAYPKRSVEYPILTLKITNMDASRLGMQSKISWVVLNVEIRVWARNSKESDTLTQDVVNKLRTLQYGASSTTEEEIYGFKLDNAVPIIETDGEATIHSKVLTFTYKCLLSD